MLRVPHCLCVFLSLCFVAFCVLFPCVLCTLFNDHAVEETSKNILVVSRRGTRIDTLTFVDLGGFNLGH